jgi:hypothetical protein
VAWQGRIRSWELIRQTTFVRVGSLVTTLLYLRSVDFPRTTPGRGYPESAVIGAEGAQ